MKTRRVNILVASTLAGLTFASLTEFAIAQAPPTADPVVQTQAAPKPAPSLFQQAGKKIFESAQKKVIQNLNQKMNPTQPATTQAGTTVPAQAGVPGTSGTSLPGQALVDPMTGLPLSNTAIPQTTAASRQAAPCRSWVNPNEKPVAALLCIHGLGLQSNSYEFFAKEQSNRGIAVYAIDVRGFGSWMRSNGKEKVNFEDCLLDIKQALESIRAAHPGVPVYVLGESMGGAIALRAASMYPDIIDGLVSSVPAGERFKQEKTSMKVFLNMLTGTNLANVGGDIINQATQNDKLKAQWSGDPLSRLNLSPAELIQFQDFMNSNHEAAKKVTDMPVLFVQGNGDQLVKPEGTWELFNAVASKDKSFFAVPGEHLIFEEAQTQQQTSREQNFRIIQAWLTSKVGRRNRRGGGYAAGGPGGGGYGQRAGFGNGTGYGGGQGYGYGSGQGFRRNFYSAQGSLAGPSQMIDNGQYQDAIAELEQIAASNPGDPNVASMLGRAYFESGQPERAGQYFRRAMRLDRNNREQANALNAYLLDLNQNAQTGQTRPAATASPFAGFGQILGSLTGTPALASTANAAMGKVKVYAFYADWADQCKNLNGSLAQLSNAFANRLDIQKVNVEDPTSEALVDKFKIGPIPSVVFVTPTGQVSSTIIGESNYTNYEAACRQSLQASARR
jgi:alpha-beta hydrolase superfamily lysophospholipase/thiol-disulfide isomerase/thioredoxin